MSLASLLKKGSLRGLATATPATPATDSAFIPSTVATVAVAKAPDRAANDPAQAPDLVTGGAVIPLVTAEAAFPKEQLRSELRTETAVTPDPDRWCWPHSTAMNGAEIDNFTARLHQFTRRGLAEGDSEALADKLVIRDREQDDRHSCFECTHLAGAGGWRCGNWQRAGVATRARDAQLPTDFVKLLQRCDGFTQAIHFQKQTGGHHGEAQAN